MRSTGEILRRSSWLSRAACLLLLAAASACWGNTGTPGEERVGDLSDHSYSNARGKERISASGEMVRMEQFEGRFVWAEYAAPWCSPCSPQASAIRELESTTSDMVVFLTIMTSDMGGYGDPATRATAQSWAGRHGLDPAHVLAADLTATTVPRHILYSPTGQMLFLKTGAMSAQAIRDIIDLRATAWNH